MLRKPSWSVTAVPALGIALVAVYTSQASHAAPETSKAAPEASQAAAETCLSAPNGAAPKGQHWYYHLDRATQRKCWYLHETIASPTAGAVKPSARADSSARPAAPVETARPTKRGASSQPQRDASAQPTGASSAESDTSSHTDEATAAIAAPAPVNTKTAAPLEPVSEAAAARSAATVWPDTAPPASGGVQEADATPSGSAPAVASNAADTGATPLDEAVAQHDTKPVTATPDKPSTSSIGQDLLIIALAAALAGAVSVAFVVIRRRKSVKAKFADIIAVVAALAAAVSANVAALRRRERAKATPADFISGFGTKTDRQSVGKSTLQSCKAESPQSVPLVPEQLTMARPFVAPRRQERENRHRRAAAE